MDKLNIKKNFKSAANEGGGLGMPLGRAEEAILRVVYSQDFVTISCIQQKIDEAFGGGMAVGAIYTTLHRLKQVDYVLSTKSPPLPERGGKARNVYSITAEGLQALEEQERKNQLIKSLSGSRPVPRKTTPGRAAPGL